MSITRDATYALGDRLPFTVKEPFNVRARWTGEFYSPCRGEWYLSGAIIIAYRAPNDLDTPFHIAELVRIEERKVVVERLDDDGSPLVSV